MFGGGSTLYDRTKKTGYMIGPSHKMRAAFDDQADDSDTDPTMTGDEPADNDGGEETGEPPNLRDSADRPNSCADCQHFEPAGQDGESSCSKYGGVGVTPNEVCDGFEGKTEEADEALTASSVDSQEGTGF